MSGGRLAIGGLSPMKPYSHFIVAVQLENEMCPKFLADYYWGSVAPDVRFSAGLTHEQTHLPVEKIVDYLEKYPHLESFLKGYLVHCLTDSFDITSWLKNRMMLRPFLKQASHQFILTILEVYYFENKPAQKPISGNINELLLDLGIFQDNIEKEIKVLKAYLGKPDLDTNIAYMKTGQNLGLKQYVKEIESIRKNPFIKPLWFSLADFNGLNSQVITQVRQNAAFVSLYD
jgi:hypothetical protein